MSPSPIIIGLTGSYGSGKSTVGRMFRSLGAHIVDADGLARAYLRPGNGVYRTVVRRFGAGILGPGREINRPALAAMVFSSPRRLASLQELVHPCVLKAIRERMRAFRSGVLVIDAPLLFETGLAAEVDKVVVVRVSPGVRIARMRGAGAAEHDVNARLRNQLPQRKKEALADYIVDNDGTLGGTKKQVVQIWHELRQKQRSKKTKQK